jgi:hypothetical protein
MAGEGTKSGNSSKRVDLFTPLSRDPSGMNHFMNSVKYVQEEEEDTNDPNKFERKNTGGESDREAFKQETIRKKRLKFDTIPVKNVLEVRKSALR